MELHLQRRTSLEVNFRADLRPRLPQGQLAPGKNQLEAGIPATDLDSSGREKR